MNIEFLSALRKLYPQVVVTRGDEAFDVDGNQVTYDLQAVTEQAQKDDCVSQAKSLLQSSDWSALPDVDLANKAEFVAYRATLRNLVLNPVTEPVFPTTPTPVWSNA